MADDLTGTGTHRSFIYALNFDLTRGYGSVLIWDALTMWLQR